MTTPLPSAQLTRTITALSHAGLIRLISEIDDNGPVPRRMLGHTFPDVARHLIRHAMRTAREQKLVYLAEYDERTSHALTAAGTELAELYDASARWARQHHYPQRGSSFILRTQGALALLSQQQIHSLLEARTATTDSAAQHLVDLGILPTRAALDSLAEPWTLLTRWLHTYTNALATTKNRTDDTRHQAALEVRPA